MSQQQSALSPQALLAIGAMLATARAQDSGPADTIQSLLTASLETGHSSAQDQEGVAEQLSIEGALQDHRDEDAHDDDDIYADIADNEKSHAMPVSVLKSVRYMRTTPLAWA